MKTLRFFFFALLGLFMASNADSQNTVSNHEYIDLGLPSGTLWASCNIGADSPEQYGNYYNWGSLETAESSPLDGVKCEGYAGEPKFDVATALWGEKWSTPSVQQAQELIDICKWSWTKQGDIKGYRVKGPNGNSIFLPAAGNALDEDFINHIGFYWTSSPSTTEVESMYGIGENKLATIIYCGEVLDEMDGIWERPVFRIDNMAQRNMPYSIRPVTK